MKLFVGDSRAVLRTFADASIDSVITDPPYELGFMGQSWDRSGVAYDVELWREVLRVLKPGGHLLSFGGARTYHRMACAVEDAGFDVRDQLMWIYGDGMPKGKNLEGGRATQLKPSHEPIVMARKELSCALVDNVRKHGTGALNVESCRHPTGRWPANVVFMHDGACSEDLCAPACPVRLLGQQSGVRTSGTSKGFIGDVATSVALGKKRAMIRPESIYGDTGDASRFFYCAKATAKERHAGVDGKNPHNTVKPLDVMRWLVRLVTPPGGVVLDPFMGSGTTGCAAALEGADFIGVDMSSEYVEVAAQRITHWLPKRGTK